MYTHVYHIGYVIRNRRIITEFLRHSGMKIFLDSDLRNVLDIDMENILDTCTFYLDSKTDALCIDLV